MSRRKKDSRYEDTEKKLFKSIIKYVKENPYTIGMRMSQLARESGVHLATVYRHYKGASEALFLYERRFLGKFQKRIQNIKSSGGNFGDLVFCLVDFISENREFFEVKFSSGDKRMVEKMLGKIEEEVMEFSHMTMVEMSRVREVYSGEIYGILDGWRKAGFKEDEAKRVREDIIYLSRYIKNRLGNIG